MLGLTGIPLLCASNLVNMQTHAAMYGILCTDWQLHIYIGQYIQIDLCMIQERETERGCYVLFYYILLEKPAEGGLHCYGTHSTAALQRRSDPWIIPFVCQTRSTSASSWALNRLYTLCAHNSVSRILHLPSVNTQKTWCQFFVRLGICAALFSGATNCQPPTSSWHSPCGALY